MSVDVPDSDGVPREVEVNFWTLVLLVKLAVLAVGFGMIFTLATDVPIIGLLLIGFGCFVGVHWILTYRQVREHLDGQGPQ